MKQRKQETLMVCREDYHVLMSYINGSSSPLSFNPREARELQTELKRARIVDRGEIPDDVVRLNSRVKVREKDKVVEFTLVVPEKANMRERKVSVLAPVGAALIGFRKGQQVSWKVPAGLKTFIIEEVTNRHE